jgi:hypothetical protein
VPEGKEIADTRFSDHLGTSIWRNVAEKKYFETWKQIEDARYLHQNLSKEDRPPKYSVFTAYNFKTKQLSRSQTLRELLFSSIPTVWGHSEGFTNIRDIGLVPARLKDKTSVFCGIDIIKKKIEFYIPIVRFGRHNFLLSATIVDNNEAVLTVLADLATIKFYKMTRPGK